MTSIENAIWRAPTTVLVCSRIIHAEGVPSKEMNKFRLRSFVTGHFHADLARAKFICQFSFNRSLLASKRRSFPVSAEGQLRPERHFSNRIVVCQSPQPG